MKWKGQRQSRNVERQAPDAGSFAKDSATRAESVAGANRALAQRGSKLQFIHEGNSDYAKERVKQQSFMPLHKLTGKTAGGPSTRVAKNSRPAVPHNMKSRAAWEARYEAEESAKKYTPSEIKASEHRRKNQTASNKLVTSKPTTRVQKRAQERERAARKGKSLTLPKTTNAKKK